MPFWGLLEYLIANVPFQLQAKPFSSGSEAALEQFSPITEVEIVPFVIDEASLEDFEPVDRSRDFARMVLLNWCGTY